MASKALKFKTAAGTVVKPRRAHYAVLGAVCALVIGVYAWNAKSGWVESLALNVDDTYYNLLVRGFRVGQLNLTREVPSGLAQLADPYDPKALEPYLAVKHPLLDQSYYKGKLYLYFGVTPALVLFWPYTALTGHCLLHRDAVVIFFSVGFLAGAHLLWVVWRRYFADVSIGVVVAGLLALGLVNFAPVILQRCDVYEVAISCGYALTMLALGARPSLLFGAIILLVPVAQTWRERAGPGHRRQVWTQLLAATCPIVLIGLGLMVYNELRFDHPLEFGSTYQLTLDRASALQQFGLRYLWFNFRVGFLAPARWSGLFPFVHDIATPLLPRGGVAEQLPFGVLTNIPLVWLAVAAPLAWRSGLEGTRSTLRGFLGALALLFGTFALTLGLHNSMCLRYQLEYVSPLVMLAVLGILGLEMATAGRPLWRRITRWGWGLLIAFSLVFNLLAMFERTVELHIIRGAFSLPGGQLDTALVHYQKAVELQADNAEAHSGLGAVLIEQGKVPEGIRHLEIALRFRPDFTDAHYNLGRALFQLGKAAEAIGHMDQVLRFKPDDAEVQHNLARVLATCGDGSVRNGARAVQLAEGVNKLAGGKDPAILDTLAAAYAEAGRFGEAVKTAQAALDLAETTGQGELAPKIGERLKLYQAGQPYHQQ